MQHVSRRQFARVLAGPAAVFATGGPVAWRPSPRRGSLRLLIHGLSTAAGLFEFRVYGSRPRAMPAILERDGIRPAWREHSANGTAYLIPFKSFEARRAWGRIQCRSGLACSTGGRAREPEGDQPVPTCGLEPFTAPEVCLRTNCAVARRHSDLLSSCFRWPDCVWVGDTELIPITSVGRRYGCAVRPGDGGK